MFDLFILHANEATEAGEVSTTLGGIVSIALYLAIFGVFYYFIIRPQRKKDKKHKEMLKNLKVGESVISAGGIKGEIVSINDEFIQVRVDKGVKLNFKKESIASVYTS